MRGQNAELLVQIARVARIVEGHWEEILANRSRALTTAFIERFNSLFSAVKSKARGYRTVEYMTAMFYSLQGNSPFRTTDPLKVVRDHNFSLTNFYFYKNATHKLQIKE
jgi:hypothetical protein